MGGRDDHDADINTIQLALKDRRLSQFPWLSHTVVLFERMSIRSFVDEGGWGHGTPKSCMPGMVHSMVAINETKHRCINCGKTEEME